MARTWEERITAATDRSARALSNSLRSVIENAVRDKLYAELGRQASTIQIRAMVPGLMEPGADPPAALLEVVGEGIIEKLNGIVPDEVEE